jgi:hypothetical protein
MAKVSPVEREALTFDEKLACAYLHYVRGIMEMDLAVAFNVNMGRVSEACTAIKDAVDGDRPYRRRRPKEESGGTLPLNGDGATE